MNSKPTKEELRELEDIDPCRHGRRLWCEDCVTDAYVLHTVIGRQEAFRECQLYLEQKAGTSFVAHDLSLATKYREAAAVFRTKYEEETKKADGIRRQQGIKS